MTASEKAVETIIEIMETVDPQKTYKATVGCNNCGKTSTLLFLQGKKVIEEIPTMHCPKCDCAGCLRTLEYYELEGEKSLKGNDR